MSLRESRSESDQANTAEDVSVDVLQEPAFQGRDLEIVGFLESEELTSFTFDGLRRGLGIHPETLSRSLDRLEEQGVVEKTPEGYRVSGELKQLITTHPAGGSENPIPLVQTLLPHDVSLDQIISSLKGRWFGTLRWLGYSENRDVVVLKWVTESGGINVDAKFSKETLDIEARVKQGKSVDEAVRAGHQLISHIARIYARPRRVSLVSFVIFDPYKMFA